MRTDEEITARIEEQYPEDMLGFMTQDLILALPFDKAKPYLSDTVTAETWTPKPRDADSLKCRMVEYMPFAWDKANNKRGISAARSLCHYASWLWLAGVDLGNLTEYTAYGKEHLRRICEYLGLDPDQWDDGVREDA